MGKTGLFIALAAAAFFVLLFTLYPEIDLALARLFYDSPSQSFPLSLVRSAAFAREAAMWIAWAFAVPAIVALAVKLIWPRKRLLISGRAIVFLVPTLLLSVVLSNFAFKSHWSRPRPVATAELGGAYAFMPWWDPRGSCPRNCSFFSAEAATAFWTYAPAALTPPAVRPFAYMAATAFGLVTGAWRMAFGGHYASDVIVAGLATFIIVWIAYHLVYRRFAPRLTDDTIDRWIGDAALALRREVTKPGAAPPERSALPGSFWMLAAALAALTAFRIALLNVSALDLSLYEAQSWAWAQIPLSEQFARPLLARIAAEAAQVCGPVAACLRAPSALFHFATAIVSYLIARDLYDTRVAFWTSLCVALAPVTIFSARVMSADAPLLLFFALALLAYVRLLNKPVAGTAGWRWAIVLGLSLGLGLLATYQMAYFFVGVVLVEVSMPRDRALLRRPQGWLAMALMLATVAPNLLSQTGADLDGLASLAAARDGGLPLDPRRGLEFMVGEFVMFGPIVLGIFLLALSRIASIKPVPADRIMIAFALPALVLTTIGAFVMKPDFGWAAAAAIPLTIVAVAVLTRAEKWRWLQASAAIGLAVQMVLPVADAFATRVSLPFLKNPDIYAPLVGWSQLALQVERAAQAHGARSIVSDRPDLVAALAYYLRENSRPIVSWREHSEEDRLPALDKPSTRAAPEPLLYVTDCALPGRMFPHFASVEVLPPVSVLAGPHTTRQFAFYKLSGHRGDDAPPGPCGP